MAKNKRKRNPKTVLKLQGLEQPKSALLKSDLSEFVKNRLPSRLHEAFASVENSAIVV